MFKESKIKELVEFFWKARNIQREYKRSLRTYMLERFYAEYKGENADFIKRKAREIEATQMWPVIVRDCNDLNKFFTFYFFSPCKDNGNIRLAFLERKSLRPKVSIPEVLKLGEIVYDDKYEYVLIDGDDESLIVPDEIPDGDSMFAQNIVY